MQKTAEKLKITIGKSIKLSNKIIGMSVKSAARAVNSLYKKTAKTADISPNLLLTENRGDIRYQISFLKDVLKEKKDPRKTAYYAFLLDFCQSHDPDEACRNFLKLRSSIKKYGIREPICATKPAKDSFTASYSHNGKKYRKKYRNKTGYQLYDGAKRTAIAIFERYPKIPCRIFNPVGFEIRDYTSHIHKNEKMLMALASNPRLAELHKSLNKSFHRYSKEFGRGKFYQGLKSIFIEGQRPTEERFKAYGMKKFLKKNFRVLDIGSNCGFFSLYVSQFVKSVDGIEKDPHMAEVANKTKKYLKVKNCAFYRSAFEEFRLGKKYDCIMSFAVHSRVGHSLEGYLGMLDRILNKNGILVIESHDINKEEMNFGKGIKAALGKKYAIAKEEKIKDDGIVERKFLVLRKK